MNYSQLVTEIQTYTENVFSVPDINTFIQQAEQRIYNSVQIPVLRRASAGNTTANNRYLTTPADYLAVSSLAITKPDGTQEYLLNKDVDFIRESFPKPADTGVPQYYAVFDDNTLLLGPTPDADYVAELHYFYYPESIVTAGTTWLGDNFDSTLLYGALLEAYTFMKGEQDVMAAYKMRYDEAMQLLKQLADGKNRRDTYRSGQIRIPAQ